jgi:hypothetical protein
VSEREIQVRIGSRVENSTSGQVLLKSWTKQERTRRSFKALGFCWLLAVGAVLIPILHFVLVPTFLLAGPIAFFWVANQEDEISGGKGVCPECSKEFEIVRTAVKWPITDICNHCRAELKIFSADSQS